jgi:hypothetical protein
MSRDTRLRTQLRLLMPTTRAAEHPSDEFGTAGDDMKRRS